MRDEMMIAGSGCVYTRNMGARQRLLAVVGGCRFDDSAPVGLRDGWARLVGSKGNCLQ